MAQRGQRERRDDAQAAAERRGDAELAQREGDVELKLSSRVESEMLLLTHEERRSAQEVRRLVPHEPCRCSGGAGSSSIVQEHEPRQEGQK